MGKKNTRETSHLSDSLLGFGDTEDPTILLERDLLLFCCVGNKVIAHVALGSRCGYVQPPFACLMVVVYFSLVMMLRDEEGGGMYSDNYNHD